MNATHFTNASRKSFVLVELQLIESRTPIKMKVDSTSADTIANTTLGKSSKHHNIAMLYHITYMYRISFNATN